MHYRAEFDDGSVLTFRERNCNEAAALAASHLSEGDEFTLQCRRNDRAAWSRGCLWVVNYPDKLAPASRVK